MSACCPSGLKRAEMTTLVSRTALSIGNTAPAAVAVDFQVDFAQRQDVWFLGFRLSLNLCKCRRLSGEVSNVFFHTHNHSLRLAALVYDKSFLILAHAPKNLA